MKTNAVTEAILTQLLLNAVNVTLDRTLMSGIPTIDLSDAG